MSDDRPNDQLQSKPVDTFAYDVYISCSDADLGWVHTVLLPRFKAESIRACISDRDFRLGVPRITEQERAILTSRKTLLVLTPSFLASGWTAFDRLLQQTLDAESHEYRLLPLRKELCELPSSLRYLTAANFVDPRDPPAEWMRLIETLRTALPMSPPPAIPVLSIPTLAPLPLGSHMPLSRNPLFVGREDDLRQIARALHVGRTAAIGQVEIAAATGLGGIGKTQLACEFVHRYGQFFAGGVFWLSFADPASVPSEVAACGGADGMQLRLDFGTLPLDEQVKLVLASWEQLSVRLLIFDNCEDEALLEQWRPKHGGCRVLVTSRRHHWDATLGVQALPLDVLARPDSLALLRTFCTEEVADHADLDAITEALGDLPLALHLAGSFLAKYRHALTPTHYLRRLQTPTILNDRSLRAAGLSPTKHVQHVARTFEQSYERLDPTEPTDVLARTLLAHAAYFAPGEPLPRWLLLKTLVQPAEGADGALLAEDALTRLIDLGLLETDVAGDLRLHRLLVAFVRTVLVDEAPQAVVEATILRVVDDLNEHSAPRPVLTIQPHLRWITEAAQLRRDARAASLCNALGEHVQQLGIYAQAQHYYEQALAICWQVLGDNHPLTAETLSNLGKVMKDLGQYLAAQRYQEQALAIRQQVLGPNHLDTIRSLNNLGNLFYAQGQYLAAQRCHEQALAIRQQVLGPEHPDTATSLSNLSFVLDAQGQHQTAQRYLEQALAIRQRVLGPNHYDTALSLGNLGFVLDAQGQYAAAQDYYEQALAIQEGVLGPNHPETALSLVNLGFVLSEQKQYAAAQDYYERALAIWQQALGVEHPYTASALHDLGELLHRDGHYAAAQGYLEQALAIRQRVLGVGHPDIARSLRGLGELFYNQGDITQARHYLEQALAIFELRLGPDHPDTEQTYRALATLDAPHTAVPES